MASITAGVIAAGIGAVGSVASGAISAGAAKSAADTQSAAAQQASQNALQQYYQTRADLSPFRVVGQNAADQLAAIFGLPTTAFAGGGGGAAPSAAPSTNAGGGSPQGLPPGWRIQQGSTQQSGDNFAFHTDASVIDQNGNVIATIPGSSGSTLTPQDAASFLMSQGMLPGSGGGSNPLSGGGAPPPAAPGPNPLSSYGLSGLTFQPTQAQLSATPGYQWDLSQGLQGVANSNAAKGLGISGPALKGAAAYATGLANNTLTTQQGIFQQNLGNVINPLQFMANLGQTSAATTGQLGMQGINNANQALIGGANAQAAGTIGQANAFGNALGGLGNSATNYLLFNNLNGGGGGTYPDNGLLFNGVNPNGSTYSP